VLAVARSPGSRDIRRPVPDGRMESTEERIVAVTRRVIDETLQTGAAVFVGRGAQCLLAERSDALHVFCFAPRAALRKYAMEKFHVDAAEAERRVAEMNRQREQYVKQNGRATV